MEYIAIISVVMFVIAAGFAFYFYRQEKHSH